MAKIVSNLQSVLNKHRVTIEKLRNPEIILRTAAFNLLAEISARIQNRGETTNGELIGNGEYSAKYGRYRAKRGKQISFVDLTFDGTTLDRNFTVLLDQAGANVGFTVAKSAEIMGYLEELYGTDIIKASEEEIKNSINFIIQDIQNVIKSDNSGN